MKDQMICGTDNYNDYFPGAPDVMTPMEAARMLRVGRTTMYNLLGDGSLRSIKIGRKLLVPKACLNTFIAAQDAVCYHQGVQVVDNLSCCEKGAAA